MKTQLAIYFLFFGIVLISCKKTEKPCSDIYEGDFSYTQKSLESIPYLDKSMIFFKDSLGNEIGFTVEDQGDRPISREFPSTCETNYYDTVVHHYDVKRRLITLDNDSIDFYFEVGLSTLMEWSYFNEFDKLYVSHNLNDSTFFGNFEMISDRRALKDKQVEDINFGVAFEKEQTIFGEVFNDVYHVDYFDYFAPHKLFYNNEFGVVSFKDNTGKRWVFERFN